MLKNKVMAAALLGTMAFPAAAEANFMNGGSIGLMAGMHSTNFGQKGKSKKPHYNGFVPALCFDYYAAPSAGQFFVGFGGDVSFSSGKKRLENDDYSLDLYRDFSGALKLAIGVASGSVAFEGNVAIVATNLGVKVKDKDTDESEVVNQVMVGVAPGAAMHFSIAKNTTLGINYRYEIYKPSKFGKLKINSHVVGIKLAYKF